MNQYSTLQKPLTTFIFTGELASRFGEKHTFRAANLQDATSAFRVLIPGFADYVLSKDQDGLVYRCINIKRSGKENLIDKDSLDKPFGSTQGIIISPVAQGSGGQSLRFLTGALLVGVGIFTGQVYLTSLGASQLLSGIAGLLAPPQKTPKSGSDEEESFLLSGLRGTSEENLPVPLIYGRCFIQLNIRLSEQTTTSEFRS